ncbi:MAG: pilus assembly protein TadG-related protein [Nostocoides sp.]
MSERDARHDERGQLTTALTVMVALLMLGFGVSVIVPIARASDQSNRIQNAADAAALAGAQFVADHPHGRIVAALRHTPNPLPGPLFACGDGSGAASDFASRNDSSVTSYCYYPERDRVEVTVRSNFTTESGTPEGGSAAASAGLAIAPCDLTDVKPGIQRIYCGGVEVKVKVPDAPGQPIVVLTSARDVKDQLHPHLSD